MSQVAMQQSAGILMAYAARCPGCNEIVGVTSDRPQYKKDVAKTVAGWIADGCHIERMTAGEVRQAWGDGCACEGEGEV